MLREFENFETLYSCAKKYREYKDEINRLAKIIRANLDINHFISEIIGDITTRMKRGDFNGVYEECLYCQEINAPLENYTDTGVLDPASKDTWELLESGETYFIAKMIEIKLKNFGATNVKLVLESDYFDVWSEEEVCGDVSNSSRLFLKVSFEVNI